MDKIKCIVTKNGFAPFSQEDAELHRNYKLGQWVNCKVSGARKPRSWKQSKGIHAVFREVAANSEDPEWNTPERVKRSVKMAIRFFKDDVVVVDNKVFFELRSFAFDKMEHEEANKVFSEVVQVCAGVLGVDPETLLKKAQEEA